MTPAEADRIRQAAVRQGREERRSQGIPERVEDNAMTAQLVALLAPLEAATK